MNGKKVQVYFDSGALEVLARLQESGGGSSMSEVLRDSLAFYDWALGEVVAGRSVGSFGPDGSNIKELVLFRSARPVV
jgi:hypothetical protein